MSYPAFNICWIKEPNWNPLAVFVNIYFFLFIAIYRTAKKNDIGTQKYAEATNYK